MTREYLVLVPDEDKGEWPCSCRKITQKCDMNWIPQIMINEIVGNPQVREARGLNSVEQGSNIQCVVM